MAMYQTSDNADLWGLNPQTGQLYTVRERRAALADRGVRGNIGGPLPSMMWDDYTDRVYSGMHGLPEGFRAPVAGGQLSPAAEALNRTLMKRARSAESSFEPGPISAGMPNSPDLSMGAFEGNAHVRPSLKPLQAYRGYETSGADRQQTAQELNQNSRRANRTPYATGGGTDRYYPNAKVK